MEAKDWITVAALILGPVVAVIITLWFQKRSEKQTAKQRLFAALMSQRVPNPPTSDWVNGLNLIDVVFQDDRSVVDKWHELFDSMNHSPSQLNNQRIGHLRIELLSEMAVSLGYNRLSQTDIDRFYKPQAMGDEAAAQMELRTELVRVLKDTKSLQAVPKTSDRAGRGQS
jgi:hypothetical protein